MPASALEGDAWLWVERGCLTTLDSLALNLTARDPECESIPPGREIDTERDADLSPPHPSFSLTDFVESVRDPRDCIDNIQLSRFRSLGLGGRPRLWYMARRSAGTQQGEGSGGISFTSRQDVGTSIVTGPRSPSESDGTTGQEELSTDGRREIFCPFSVRGRAHG